MLGLIVFGRAHTAGEVDRFLSYSYRRISREREKVWFTPPREGDTEGEWKAAFSLSNYDQIYRLSRTFMERCSPQCYTTDAVIQAMVDGVLEEVTSQYISPSQFNNSALISRQIEEGVSNNTSEPSWHSAYNNYPAHMYNYETNYRGTALSPHRINTFHEGGQADRSHITGEPVPTSVVPTEDSPERNIEAENRPTIRWSTDAPIIRADHRTRPAVIHETGNAARVNNAFMQGQLAGGEIQYYEEPRFYARDSNEYNFTMEYGTISAMEERHLAQQARRERAEQEAELRARMRAHNEQTDQITEATRQLEDLSRQTTQARGFFQSFRDELNRFRSAASGEYTSFETEEE